MESALWNIMYKKYFGTSDIDNALPYFMRYVAAKSDKEEKVIKDSRLTADILPITFVKVPIPVYELYGSKHISIRTLAGVIGSCARWENPTDARAYHQGREQMLRKVLIEEGYDLKDPDTKKQFMQFQGFLFAAYTPSNTVPTYRNLRYVTNHTNSYLAKSGRGVLKMTKPLQDKVTDLLSSQYILSDFSVIDRHFVTTDYRVGTYLVNKEACRNIINKYVNYNHQSNPGIKDLAMSKVHKIIGPESLKPCINTISVTIQYDLKKLVKFIEDSGVELDAIPINAEVFFKLSVANALKNVIGFKDLHWKQISLSGDSNV